MNYLCCEWQKNSLASWSAQQIYLQSIMQNDTSTKKWAGFEKLLESLRSFSKRQLQSVSIFFKFVHPCLLSVVFGVLHIPSCNVFERLFFRFTQFGGSCYLDFILRISNFAISWQRRNISLEKRAFKLLWPLFCFKMKYSDDFLVKNVDEIILITRPASWKCWLQSATKLLRQYSTQTG